MSTRVGQSGRVKTIIETTDERGMYGNEVTVGGPTLEGSGPVIPGIPEGPTTTEVSGIGGDGVQAGEIRGERCAVATVPAGQMELGLRSTGSGRPTRPVRTRRYVAARWWFSQMREAVRSTPAWNGGGGERRGGEQVLLSLPQPPTRFERRRAA